MRNKPHFVFYCSKVNLATGECSGWFGYDGPPFSKTRIIINGDKLEKAYYNYEGDRVNDDVFIF